MTGYSKKQYNPVIFYSMSSLYLLYFYFYSFIFQSFSYKYADILLFLPDL